MNKQILSIFLSGAGLLHDEEEDAISIGSMLPSYSSQGVEKVMLWHTQIIDRLIELSQHSTLLTVQLLSMRGITFHEYRSILFDMTIHEKDFGKYPALRCFFFSSNKERREKVIYHYNKDRANDYNTLLAQMLQHTHPNLFSFLFTDEG